MSEKIIFLDIDGVLNSASWGRHLSNNHEKKYYMYELLCQEMILHLQDIVFTTNAKIVLSSSWRLSKRCMTMLEEQLRPYNLEIFDKTISDPTGERGDEIKEWLSRHPEVTHFVILDDDSDMSDVKDHLIKTTFQYGLQAEHAAKAIEMLTSKN